MPNIGALLKEEISRLSRRQVRSQVEATRKASSQHRRNIAALKRQVATLERRLVGLERSIRALPHAASEGSSAKRPRFVAKGLRSQRARLGLSAADYGRLVGVSAQSIYNWEQASASPRAEQVAALATLRGIAKKEAKARLKQLDAKKAKPRRKT